MKWSLGLKRCQLQGMFEGLPWTKENHVAQCLQYICLHGIQEYRYIYIYFFLMRNITNMIALLILLKLTILVTF